MTKRKHGVFPRTVRPPKARDTRGVMAAAEKKRRKSRLTFSSGCHLTAAVMSSLTTWGRVTCS